MNMQSIIDALKQTIGGEILLTFLLSMAPIAELRGAIPFGIALGLDHWTAMVVSIIGNMVPVPFIIVFIRRIFAWLRGKNSWFEGFIASLEKRTLAQESLVHKYKHLGLMILVAIPLPGTGAWTGALLAALLSIRMKWALPSIFAGVVIAGFLITGLMFGFTSLV